MTPENNVQRHHREMAEARERLQAETATNPQFAAMSKAAQPTTAEREQIEAAEAAVTEAEEAVNAAGIALDRARRGMAPVRVPDNKRPFSFFERPAETYKAAREALPGSRTTSPKRGCSSPTRFAAGTRSSAPSIALAVSAGGPRS